MAAPRLAAGLAHQAVFTVTAEMSPPHIHGILATSRMIGLAEDVCLAAVQPLLAAGHTTVGTRVDLAHVGTAWAGEAIEIRVELTRVTAGRLLTFAIEVAAPAGVVGSGTHQRLVIDRARFSRPAPAPT